MTQYTIDDASKGQGPANQHREILCSLIAAIGKHAVDETGDELERYRHRLGAEAAGLSDDSGIGGEQTAVKGVIRVMAEHNEAVKADYRLRTSELGRALRIMVETIGDVSTSSQAAVHQLSVIEKNLEEATAGPDAARFRSKLEVCVKMIREHSQILRTQTENQVNQLKSFVASRAPG